MKLESILKRKAQKKLPTKRKRLQLWPRSSQKLQASLELSRLKHNQLSKSQLLKITLPKLKQMHQLRLLPMVIRNRLKNNPQKRLQRKKLLQKKL